MGIKDLLVGAVVGTLLGTISAVVLPQREKILAQLREGSDDLAEATRDWTDTVGDIGGRTFDNFRNIGHERSEASASSFLAGSLVGALLGAGSALLLSPKNGRQLRRDLLDTYENAQERTYHIMDLINNGAQKTRRKARRLIKKRAHPLVRKAKARMNHK